MGWQAIVRKKSLLAGDDNKEDILETDYRRFWGQMRTRILKHYGENYVIAE